MPSGRVKWFNNAKGYGFILPEGGGEDLFVHYSSIQMEGYKTLKAGQEVEYDLHQGPKGMHAVNIQAAESEESFADADGEADADERAERTRRIADEVRKTLTEKFSEPSH